VRFGGVVREDVLARMIECDVFEFDGFFRMMGLARGNLFGARRRRDRNRAEDGGGNGFMGRQRKILVVIAMGGIWLAATVLLIHLIGFRAADVVLTR
jgi:hypothetical protein